MPVLRAFRLGGKLVAETVDVELAGLEFRARLKCVPVVVEASVMF